MPALLLPPIASIEPGLWHKMKLLFDQNLSFRLCQLLADLFPESSQVRLLGLDRVDDIEIQQYARREEFVIVTQDADFYRLALLNGVPPKIVWLRCGNQTTSVIESLIRSHAADIQSLLADPAVACLEIYGNG